MSGTVNVRLKVNGQEHELDVEPGSQNGTVHRVRHEGVEHLHGRGRGDLFIHLTVDVPTELDDESETILRSWAEHRGEVVNEPSGACEMGAAPVRAVLVPASAMVDARFADAEPICT